MSLPSECVPYAWLLEAIPPQGCGPFRWNFHRCVVDFLQWCEIRTREQLEAATPEILVERRLSFLRQRGLTYETFRGLVTRIWRTVHPEKKWPSRLRVPFRPARGIPDRARQGELDDVSTLTWPVGRRELFYEWTLQGRPCRRQELYRLTVWIPTRCEEAREFMRYVRARPCDGDVSEPQTDPPGCDCWSLVRSLFR